MTEKIAVDDVQLQKLIASIDALSDHAPYWKHFLISAVPIFLASMLGLGTAWLLDRFKTRREDKKATRERREKELALLSGVNTAIAFNIGALVHTAMQQILPHYEQSNAACLAVEALGGIEARSKEFDERLHTEFQEIMKRCPEPYLEETNLARDLPFLVAKDPSLIMLSGWIMTYTRNLKSILIDRNKQIDEATSAKDGLNLEMLERHIATQATIAGVEVVNIYQLFLQLAEASAKVSNIVFEDYGDVIGPKLKIEPPAAYAPLMADLSRIARMIVPDWPPPEPKTTNGEAVTGRPLSS